MLRVAASLLTLLLLALAASCGGFFTSPVLSSISLSPSSVAQGQSVQVVATGTYNDGSTNTITSGLTWTSSDSTTASVNGSGVVQGVAAGTATITATASNGIQGTVSFTVTSGSITSISVSPNTGTISILNGNSLILTATGNTSGGQSNVPVSANWTATPSTAVTFNCTLVSSCTFAGVSTAVGTTVIITASSGSVFSNAVSVTITN